MMYIHNPGVHGRFYGLDLIKGMVFLENPPLIARFINDEEENSSRFKQAVLSCTIKEFSKDMQFLDNTHITMQSLTPAVNL